MNRSVYFIVFAALVAIAISKANLDNNLGSSVQVVEDINEFISKNPEVVLNPLEEQLGSRHHYTFGHRVPGDRVVAQLNNNFKNSQPQDIKLKLWYPLSSAHAGSNVSYVDIFVDHCSNSSNANITQGGIGQRQITIIFKARETKLCNYRATIYGY